MDKVEKAVIDLNGEWPEEYKNGQLLVRVWRDDLDDFRYFSWYPHWSWDGPAQTICDYPAFMEARKRLENKPTEWPKGHFYKIQTSNGYWWFSKKEPRHNRQGEIECDGLDNLMYSGNIGEPFNWRQSLEPRPQPDHKEGEGVKWEPGVYLPPKGQMVDIEGDGLVYGNGESGEVLGHIEGTAIVRMSYGLGCFEASVLKPRRSHRDKVIEAADKVLESEYIESISGAITDLQRLCALFDADMLKLPGDEQ